jgi:hypothetical protein
MNGEPLSYVSYGDLGEPGRRERIGAHVSIATATRMLERTVYRGRPLYGWTWIERRDSDAILREVILKPHRVWQRAYARTDAGSAVNLYNEVSCCRNGTVGNHYTTVRHFRYWCLDKHEEAVVAWPWIRNLIAEEVLSGADER